MDRAHAVSEGSAAAALPLIAWSRIWSPVVPDELREEAWRALDLPDSFEHYSAEFWTTFEVGAPTPVVPLLLHAALEREGAAVREDWMRVAGHLALRWGDVHVPPDQLGAACELYACAIEREEPVLIEELRRRYLLPWCAVARTRLDGASSRLAFLPERFKADLLALRTAA
jgi:TorA maturation chaperone TorD